MNYIDINTPRELFEYMSLNMTYGFIGKNKKTYTDSSSQEWDDWATECVVQTGDEVLKTNVGTCWDQVEFERLWFKNNNYIFKTFFICYKFDEPVDLPTHTLLLFEENDKWYWFEHSWFVNKGIYEFNTIDEALNLIVDKHLSSTINSSKITSLTNDNIHVYTYDEIPKGLDVNSYLNYVTSNEYYFNKNADKVNK